MTAVVGLYVDLGRAAVLTVLGVALRRLSRPAGVER